jgi:hypothetical protein
MAKYRNKKVRYNGIVFDSKKEALRYKELLLLERSKEIFDLELQVKFELLPSQKEQYIVCINGKERLKTRVIERPVYYVADFVYNDKNGVKIVEDTKGLKTKDYILKRKMLLYFKGIKIKEI